MNCGFRIGLQVGLLILLGCSLVWFVVRGICSECFALIVRFCGCGNVVFGWCFLLLVGLCFVGLLFDCWFDGLTLMLLVACFAVVVLGWVLCGYVLFTGLILVARQAAWWFMYSRVLTG